MSSLKHGSYSRKLLLLSHILPIISMFRLSQSIHSSLFSPTVNFTVLYHIHSAINTPSYLLPLHTHSTPSAKANTPPTQLLRSAASNITTPHDTDSTQDSTHPYITILTTILNICWYTCLFVCLFMLHSYRSVHAVSWRPDLQVYARRWSQKPVPRALLPPLPDKHGKLTGSL
jgi:hypothetical protein